MGEKECKAIMEQKNAKGKKCWRPAKENGYCGIHQKHTLIEIEMQNNKKKCSTYRCIQFLEPNSTEKYCKLCIENKNQNVKKGCNAIIDQGPNKGNICNRKILENSKYCGKHHARYILLDTAKEHNARVCDDGKRSCKNYTENGRLLCNDCLEKCREYDNNQYNERKKKNVCVTCGLNLESYIVGDSEKEIQKCEKCYKQMKEVESKRIREERNYNEERKRNISKHYNEYKKGAILRNLWFELNIEEFKSLVNQPCFYCNTYNKNESIGIDRIYSDLGYCIQNCVSCCRICNMMKSDMTPNEFIERIEKIANVKIALRDKINNKLLSDMNIQSLKELHKSYVRASIILKYVKTETIDKYIDYCVNEKRSSTYIKKIKNLKNISTESNIKIRDTIKNIFNTEK